MPNIARENPRQPGAPVLQTNPLSRIALESPPMLGVVLSVAARLIGAALAIYLAQDQSYDRTQAFAVVLAVIAVLSIVPLRGGPGGFVPALVSGALFFGGALLFDQTAGVAMLVAGAIAWAGVLIANHRAGIEPGAGIGGFFFGLGLAVASVAVILFTIDG